MVNGALLRWGAQFEGGCVQFRGKPCEGRSETGAIYQRSLYALVEVGSALGEGPDRTGGLPEVPRGLGRGPAGGRGRAPGVQERGVDTNGPRAAACPGRGLSRYGLGWDDVFWEKAPELGCELRPSRA